MCARRSVKNSDKTGQFGIARYQNGCLIPIFKTGSLNHSATLPSSECQRLSKAGRAAKEASASRRRLGGRGARGVGGLRARNTLLMISLKAIFPAFDEDPAT